MIQEHINFIREHEYIFVNAMTINPELRAQVYHIYNMTFGTNKKPNGCSRCWRTVKNELYKKYLEHNV